MRPSLKPLGEMIAAAALAALAALAAPVQAQNIGQSRSARRVPQSHSVEQANATLEQVARDRAAVNDEFAASERVCYSKFFVNNCLDKAKEKRRVALSNLRAVEVEAQHFKRADSVARRDADLPSAPARMRTTRPRARHSRPSRPRWPTKRRVHRRKPARWSTARAEHAAKLKRIEAQDAAGAGKRAANVAAFERKKADSERRQAEVAKKKAESDAKRAPRRRRRRRRLRRRQAVN